MVRWIRVTKDKYELPEYIADTAEELADMLGISPNTIYSSMANWEKGRVKTSPYRKVVIK
jgi:DNA-binding XRE family transcriptional regulator